MMVILETYLSSTVLDFVFTTQIVALIVFYFLNKQIKQRRRTLKNRLKKKQESLLHML
jgi:hypothetical protein